MWTQVTVLESQCKWEDNIKMDVKEMGWEGMNWIHMTQDRDKGQAVVNIIIYLQATLNVTYFVISWGVDNFSTLYCLELLRFWDTAVATTAVVWPLASWKKDHDGE